MNYTRLQLYSLVALRFMIGWHFLYEGVIKLFNPYWSAKGYLLSAEGWFAPFFTWLAGDAAIGAVNGLTIWLSIAVGALLLLGSLTRFAAVVGCLLLLAFYLAHPPLHGMSAANMGGSYWLVNYNLIEIAALLVILAFPTSRYFGLDNLLNRRTEP